MFIKKKKKTPSRASLVQPKFKPVSNQNFDTYTFSEPNPNRGLE